MKCPYCGAVADRVKCPVCRAVMPEQIKKKEPKEFKEFKEIEIKEEN